MTCQSNQPRSKVVTVHPSTPVLSSSERREYVREIIRIHPSETASAETTETSKSTTGEWAEATGGTRWTILVESVIVTFTSARVGEDGVGLYYEFEFFFVTTLKKKLKNYVSNSGRQDRLRPHLVGVVLERFSPVRLLDINFCAIPWYPYVHIKNRIKLQDNHGTDIRTQNLVIILWFAPLQCRLRLSQLVLQTSELRCLCFGSCLFQTLLEVCDTRIELLQVKVDPCACSKSLVGNWLQFKRCRDIFECFSVLVHFDACSSTVWKQSRANLTTFSLFFFVADNLYKCRALESASMFQMSANVHYLQRATIFLNGIQPLTLLEEPITLFL